MAESLPPTILTWLRQAAQVPHAGQFEPQVLLHLLERVEALEHRPIPGFVELAAPTPEAAPVATDAELEALYKLPGTFADSRRAIYNLGRQYEAAQLWWGHPAAPPAPELPQPLTQAGEGEA
jgi:hypothetical protein